MKGRFWDDINPARTGSREMSFWGDFLVFMEPGAFCFQRLKCRRPESAKILEPDFRKRNVCPWRTGEEEGCRNRGAGRSQVFFQGGRGTGCPLEWNSLQERVCPA